MEGISAWKKGLLSIIYCTCSGGPYQITCFCVELYVGVIFFAQMIRIIYNNL